MKGLLKWWVIVVCCERPGTLMMCAFQKDVLRREVFKRTLQLVLQGTSRESGLVSLLVWAGHPGISQRFI